jgi:hypothetical protein
MIEPQIEEVADWTAIVEHRETPSHVVLDATELVGNLSARHAVDGLPATLPVDPSKIERGDPLAIATLED